MLNSLLRVSVIAGLVAMLGAPSAGAAPITVTPGAVGEPNAPFTASFADFSYVALVDQTAQAGTGSFSIEGGGFFSSFRNPTLDAVVTNTGINSDYKIYSTFSGAGTVAPTAGVPGGLTATYNSFDLQLFVDKNLDTAITADGVGAPNGTVTATGGTADDVLVATSSGFVSGEAHVFPGLANGDFNVLVNVNAVGGFLSGGLLLDLADFNGVNTTLTGFGMGDFTDGRIDGSGNLSFSVIPEPTTLLLVGSGIAGLGLLRRRTQA